MKTLTEKYNAVLEGTFAKKQFVRDAKLSHPNFITQFTSYEDAVKILRNKGLVHETKKEEVELNLPLSTLDKAIRYELEKAGVDYLMAAPNTDDYLKAKAKAEKALAKDRLYYLELNTSKKKRTDLMEPVTAKNVVDKGNEMKKVKTVKESNLTDLKEAVKKIIVRTLTEGMSDQEYSDAKEAERLEKHPERKKIKAVQTLIKKEKPVKEASALTSKDREKLIERLENIVKDSNKRFQDSVYGRSDESLAHIIGVMQGSINRLVGHLLLPGSWSVSENTIATKTKIKNTLTKN